jgi:nitrogen-specific signal transduction histidine kinase
MEDLSLHILDCTQNSIRAGAKLITITIDEKRAENMLSIIIEDNGQGMDKEILEKVRDPFFSTKPDKRTGLGISLLAQATQESDGTFDIISAPDKGTTIRASFKYDHIDRKSLGNMADTVIALIAGGNGSVDIRYIHSYDGRSFEFDTKAIKDELQDIPINDPAVLVDLKKQIEKAVKEIREP